MTLLELDDNTKNWFIVANFIQQNLKKNLEELKTIAEKYVKVNDMQDVYNEFTVNDKNITYKDKNLEKEIKNWDEYTQFLWEVEYLAEDLATVSFVNFIQENKLDETPIQKNKLDEMTSLELDDYIKDMIIVANFIKQNLKKNLEELKNIAEEFVKFNKKQDDYKEFTVKDDKKITYEKNDILKEIKNWGEYTGFLMDVNGTDQLVNFMNKLDETPWYKKVWVWLLIVLTILFVRYSMIKVKK